MLLDYLQPHKENAIWMYGLQWTQMPFKETPSPLYACARHTRAHYYGREESETHLFLKFLAPLEPW